MAAVVVDPSRIKAFRTEQAFETWLSKHHDKATELWIRIYALAFRLGNLKTAAGREKKIAAFVQMLHRGETLHPLKSSRRSD